MLPLMHISDEGGGGYHGAHLLADVQDFKLLLIKKKKLPALMVANKTYDELTSPLW